MKNFLIFSLLFCFLWGSLFAKINPAKKNDIFDHHELLEITLKLDVRKLQADRNDSAEYHKASLIYGIGEDKINLPVKVKPRGNFRLNPNVCEFPPLWFRFEKKHREGTIFDKHKKLKVVTTCQGEDLVLKEYLLYRHFALLSPYSFRVRLVKILIEDTDDVIEDRETFAFFIEDDKRLAKRLDGELYKGENLLPTQTQKDQLALVHMFQYQIGNTDWDVYLAKNIELVVLENESTPIAVPFDFDWSKVCDAPYTELESTFDRRQFRPICLSREEYEKVRTRYNEKKEEIYLLYKEFPHLKKKKFKDIKVYFDAFYKTINDEETIRNTFLNHCDSVGEGAG